MTEYCKIYGNELDGEEEEEGICRSCKRSKESQDYGKYEPDEDYIDPGVT